MKLKNWQGLERLAAHYDVPIDPDKPRESRLAVAFECEKHGKVHEAIEAMTGAPTDEQNPMEMIFLIALRTYFGPETAYNRIKPVDLNG